MTSTGVMVEYKRNAEKSRLCGVGPVFASFANVVWRMSRLKDVLQRARDQPRTGGSVNEMEGMPEALVAVGAMEIG
jgi:hypothetical protein